MKALTLTQPWATLVALGVKRFETRSWSTPYRGPIAIHAAKGLGPVGGAAGLCQFYWHEPFHTVLAEAGYTADLDHVLPRGEIVAVAQLTDVIRVETLTALPFWQGWNEHEHAFGDYSSGRFAWHLADVRVLPAPIPCRGALGLWDAPAEVSAQLETKEVSR